MAGGRPPVHRRGPAAGRPGKVRLQRPRAGVPAEALPMAHGIERTGSAGRTSPSPWSCRPWPRAARAGRRGERGASSGIAVNADLEAESLTATATGVEAGELLEVDLRVRNLGPDPIPGFRMAVSLSVDDQPDAADLVLGTWSSAGLAAGGAFETTGSIQVPVAAAPGVYRLLLVADDDQRFAETDETNNLFATGAIQVSPPAHPDLVAEAVSFGPSAAAAGSTIDVSHQISNQGLEASGSFRLGIYLSSSPVVTTGGSSSGSARSPRSTSVRSTPPAGRSRSRASSPPARTSSACCATTSSRSWRWPSRTTDSPRPPSSP